MFDFKNLSPRLLAFYTALFIALPVAIITLLFDKRWQLSLLIFLLVCLLGSVLIFWVVDKFIYRKIKVIYKFIYQTKATKREETYHKYILPKKSLHEVAEDVESWAEQNQKKVADLQANEIFRREFLQNLSHEFKTPVFAIQSYVETLQNAGQLDDALAKRFLEKTAVNVTRLSNLLQDLDEISSLERGELTLVKNNFVIQDLIKESFESISINAETKNISFSIKSGCESPISVNADKEKIRQVLLNLMENSIKYSRPGSTIKAGIYKTDDKRILVEISDEGIGIAAQSLPRIFERFYRTDSGRSMDVTGSGLGLAICKHIVEAHKQAIHIRSTENVGTTVGFTLAAKKD